MDKIIDKVLAHPIATAFVACVTLSGVADVIRAARGNTEPRCQIEIKTNEAKEET